MFWIPMLLSLAHTALGTGCDKPLGVGTESVRVDCSSPINVADKCKFAGIYTQDTWCSDKIDTYQYLQVTFPNEHHITKISIRGDPNSDSYTTHFLIAYPDPYIPHKTVFIYENSDKRKIKRFKANTNSSSIVSVDIDLLTEILFIIPYKWEPSNRTCLSFELYGCDNSSKVDHCSTNNGGCEQICINSLFGPICSCKAGYKANGKACQDIDECASSFIKCNDASSICKNSPGSYTCECKLGFKEDTNTGKCLDINECAEDPTLCSLTKKHCVNVPGSYKCTCITGYTEGPNGTCIDVDECLSTNNRCNASTSFCKNNPGSYTCECKVGFKRDKSTGHCLDIDECSGAIDPCSLVPNLICTNTFGSYQCNCKKGYARKPIGNCEDIDECQKQPSLCDLSRSTCVNLVGSYECKCNNGYKKDASNKCQAITCERFSAPVNGHLSPSECTADTLTYTTRCNILCNTGYKLRPLSTTYVTCRADGQWDYEPGKYSPICEAITCKKFSAPVNGHLSPSECTADTVTYGTKCNTHCNAGYRLRPLSATYVTCRADGQWDYEPGKYSPVCEAITCERFSAPVNGHLSPSECTADTLTYTTRCNILCNTGYKLRPLSTTYVTCRADGQWDYEPGKYSPICEVQCSQGQHYDATTQKCRPCPLGSYQDLIGQSSCKKCPAGTGTRFEGATSSANCSIINDPCLPGFFSPDGFNRGGNGSCRKCPVGSYQPKSGQVKCERCPVDASTEQEGSKRIEDCILAAFIYKVVPSSHVIKATEGDTVEISCYARGIPAPRMRITSITELLPAILRGTQKISLLASDNPYLTGIKLSVTGVTVADSAVYACIAENNFGTAYHNNNKTITVDVSLG